MQKLKIFLTGDCHGGQSSRVALACLFDENSAENRCILKGRSVQKEQRSNQKSGMSLHHNKIRFIESVRGESKKCRDNKFEHSVRS